MNIQISFFEFCFVILFILFVFVPYTVRQIRGRKEDERRRKEADHYNREAEKEEALSMYENSQESG